MNTKRATLSLALILVVYQPVLAKVKYTGICGIINSYDKKSDNVKIDNKTHHIPGMVLQPGQRVPGRGCVLSPNHQVFLKGKLNTIDEKDKPDPVN